MLRVRFPLESLFRQFEPLRVSGSQEFHGALMGETAAALVLSSNGVIEERDAAAWQDTLGAYALGSHIMKGTL